MTRSLTPGNGGEVGRVTLRKEDLQRDGLVDEDGQVEPANIVLERQGPGRYEVVVLDDGQPLEEKTEALASADD